MSEHPGYFGGSTVRDGKVRRLEATTFKDLLAGGVNVPVHIQLTRKAFLTHPEKNTIKDGPWISPCAYPYEEEGQRGNAHATQQVLLCIDVDGGKFAAALDRDPEALRMHLHGLNFACWRTASHTPKDPHLRIIIETEPFDPALLRRYVRTAGMCLGAPDDFKGVVESSTVSQPAYRPVKFKDEEFNAVIASRTDGRAMRESDLLDEADEVDEMLGGRRYGVQGVSVADLGIEFTPLASVTLEDAENALEAIDPDCGRMTWLKVGMALRHQFHEEDDARQAYELFDEFSSRGDKYGGQKETWALWKSCKPYADGRPPVTIKSLFQIALDAGWDSSKVAVRHRASIDQWIEECEDAEELMQEGPLRIVSLPFRNEIVEDDLVQCLQNKIKALTGRKPDKRVVFAEIGKARRREKAEKQEGLSVDPPPWLRPICFVSSVNQFHNFANGMRYTPEAFNNTFSPELMPKDGAEVPANGRPIVAASDFARNVVKLPIADDVMYNPIHQGEEPFFNLDGKKYLNLYNPMTVPIANPDRAEEAGALFKRLIDAMIGEKEYRNVFLDYLSVMVKWPGRKVPWSPMLQSAEGAGKNYLGNVMEGVLGGPNVRIVDASVICDGWNDFHTQGCVLCIINELHIPGERRERITNAIKPLITDRVIAIKEKYRSARNIPNFVCYIVFTNYRDAIHLKPGDRRWFVIFSPLQTKAQIAALTATGIFKDLEPLLGELSGSLRWWLLHREIASDFPFNGPPPTTKYRQMVIDDSTNPLQEAIETVVRYENNPMVKDDVLSFWHLAKSLPPEFRNQQSRIPHYLHALGYEKAHGAQYCNGSRSDVWIHPDNFVAGIGSPAELLQWRGETAGSIIDS